MASRTTRPTASKRPRSAAPLDEARRVVRGLLGPDGDGPGGSGGAAEELPAVGATGTGTERPLPEWVELNQSLFRVFAFVDVCGFTQFTDRHGAQAATEVLTRFRTACRDVSSRRGARVAKWLGDGVMLVGTEPGPVIASVAELLMRFHGDDFEIHAGIAAGTALLFEGDDYIGRPVNLAARLCEAAAPRELLAVAVDDSLPDWVEITGTVTVRAVGIGNVANVRQLSARPDAWASPVLSADHPARNVTTAPGSSPG